ncbi:PREDICTED: B3 domain-containing protein At5g57720-like [Fragaria vesca subsp. vesca]
MARSTSEPDIFTVMSSDLNTETLTIPPHIRNRMVNELFKRATFKLKNSTYCAWNVRVHKTEEGGLCFKEGWEEFLYDNSLDGKGAFEFLVLEYDGKMHFSIQTYLSVQIGALVRSSLSSGYALSINLRNSLHYPGTPLLESFLKVVIIWLSPQSSERSIFLCDNTHSS